MRWLQTIGLIVALAFTWGCKTAPESIDGKVVIKGWVKRAGYYSVADYASVTVSNLVKMAGGLDDQPPSGDMGFRAKLLTSPDISPIIVKPEKWDVPLRDLLADPPELRCVIVEKRMD
jgi:hypothetical protein